MLKRLNKITNATSLPKSDQKNLNGGILKINLFVTCDTRCIGAVNGTPCNFGNPHCPQQGFCDGQNGWNAA